MNLSVIGHGDYDIAHLHSKTLYTNLTQHTIMQWFQTLTGLYMGNGKNPNWLIFQGQRERSQGKCKIS